MHYIYQMPELPEVETTLRGISPAMLGRVISEVRVRKGLPTGSVKFKQQIEAALSIKLGDGKRGRPAKNNE